MEFNKITFLHEPPCRFCGSTEKGITQDGKSKYLKHKPDCFIFRNTTSTG